VAAGIFDVRDASKRILIELLEDSGAHLVAEPSHEQPIAAAPGESSSESLCSVTLAVSGRSAYWYES